MFAMGFQAEAANSRRIPEPYIANNTQTLFASTISDVGVYMSDASRGATF